MKAWYKNNLYFIIRSKQTRFKKTQISQFLISKFTPDKNLAQK